MNDFDDSGWGAAESDDVARIWSTHYEGHSIELEKAPGGSWYIRATAPCGSYAYDGYWRNSETKTIGQALDEALKGCILGQPS